MGLDPERVARARAKAIENDRRDGLIGKPLDPETALHGAFGKRPGGLHSAGGRPRVRWAVHPREVVRRYDEGEATLAECAREVGVAAQTVRNRLHAAGIMLLPQLCDEQMINGRAEHLRLHGDNVASAEEITALWDRRFGYRDQTRAHWVADQLGVHPAAWATVLDIVLRARAGELVELPAREVEEGTASPGSARRRSRRRRAGPPRMDLAISIEEMVSMYEGGATLEDIAEAARASKSTVRNRLREHDVTLRPVGAGSHRLSHTSVRIGG